MEGFDDTGHRARQTRHRQNAGDNMGNNRKAINAAGVNFISILCLAQKGTVLMNSIERHRANFLMPTG
jgi:hypothetical protein